MSLRAAVIEIDHRFGDAEGQLARVDAAIGGLGEVELVLLPEACLTGYVSPALDFDLSPFAEPLDGPTAARLARVARGRGVAIAAPIIERDVCGSLHNTLALFGADGALVAAYRKRHPWYPETWATPGEGPYGRAELRGVRLLLAICFDVHFVGDEGAADLDWADALLLPTAWVEGPRDADLREALLSPLCARHGVFALNANWARGAPLVRGQGQSRVIGPDGREVARVHSAPGGLGAAVVRVTGRADR